MARKNKKQTKKVENLIKNENNRAFHNNLAVYELRSVASKYKDPILNEAVEKCAQIIFNQGHTLVEWEMDRIFDS